MKIALLSLFALILGACGAPAPEVVVYTSHDQRLSEPILHFFEERTGIVARAVYDTEATKTTGLVNRLLAEASRPRCDVFWNSEIVQTLRLVERGVTQSYESPSAAGIAPAFRDAAHHWTGFAARARVIVANTDRLDPLPAFATYEQIAEAPASSLALPLFGTTATHFAHLFSVLGRASAEAWLRGLEPGGVEVLDSNGQVCDAVARGAVALGWTDTDDVAVARAEGEPVASIFPTDGVMLIPNTVAMIAGAPHPAEARALIDFLLSGEVEARLAAGPGAQIPLHTDVAAPEGVLALRDVTVLEIDWPRVAAHFDAATDLVHRVLVESPNR